jgi:hypothetical protein
MSCPNLKTYNEVRMEKLEKINKYHTQELLNKYNQFTGQTDNDVVMKQNYKQQMEKLNKEMLDMLSSDVNLLLEQHEELETKTREVNNNKELLKDLKMKIENERVSSDARKQNTSQMLLLEKNHRFQHNLYFYGNIVIFIMIITGLVYVYLKN